MARKWKCHPASISRIEWTPKSYHFQLVTPSPCIISLIDVHFADTQTDRKWLYWKAFFVQFNSALFHVFCGFYCTWVRVDRGYEITWVRVDLVRVDLGYELTVYRSTTWDGSELQSPMVRTAKEWRNACVEEPTAQNLNWCFALVLSSAATRPTCSGWIPTWPITTLYT